MPEAHYVGGSRDIGPFVLEAWRKLPIVDERYLGLFAELMARHFEAGHTWRKILKDPATPADFLRPDGEATERVDYGYDPEDEDDSPFFRDARKDFEELCGGIAGLFMRAVHADNNKSVSLQHFPGVKWLKAPFDDCRAAEAMNGKVFDRAAAPPLPAPNCDLRFCGCMLRLAYRSEMKQG